MLRNLRAKDRHEAPWSKCVLLPSRMDGLMFGVAVALIVRNGYVMQLATDFAFFSICWAWLASTRLSSTTTSISGQVPERHPLSRARSH